jgi:methionyl-tRNA formyltransferase
MTVIKLPNRRLRLGFFGTPELGRTVLQALLDADKDDVVLAVCQPDKPQGRKKKIIPPPVKVLAQTHGIEIIQPQKMRDGHLAATLAEKKLDLAIVIAYGRILTRDTLAAVPAGFWNIHTSILPRHRGASPIHHALLMGDAQTGVTLMQMTEGCDEGPILAIARTSVQDRETCTTLSQRLVKMGCELVLENLERAKNEGLMPVEQDHTRATHARLLVKEDGRLNFEESNLALDQRVRALNPWPGTFVRLIDGQSLKILQSRPLDHHSAHPPGTIVSVEKTLHVQTGQGCLEIVKLQPPGKKPMACADYLRGAGRSFTVGARFGADPIAREIP